jgi:hypothetical protein
LQPPKILGYNFAEKSKIFQFLFFKIFFIKKNNPPHRAGIKASIFIKHVGIILFYKKIVKSILFSTPCNM